MRRIFLRVLSVSVFIALSFSVIFAASAQVRIELGNSGAELKRALISEGYSQVRIIKQNFGATTLEGCLDGTRYRLKILFTGRTKRRNKVGTCRSEISVEQAQQILVKQGYNRIDIETRRNDYLAIACFDGDRLRVSIDRHGKVQQQRRLGRCERNRLSPSDIKADLKRQGYTRIKFTDRQLPRYVAEACRGLKRVELIIARDGDVRRENEIGRCRRAVDPRNLVKIMQQAGFEQVKVIDDQLPLYIVEACRKNQKTEFTLNRFGRIIDQYKLGKCKPLLNRAQLLSMVKSRKLTRAKIISQNNGIRIVSLCDGAARKHVTYNAMGEVLGEETKAQCRSNSVVDVYKAFVKQKISGIRFFAEGCRKGKKIRIELSNIGDPVGRETLGRCK